MPQDEMHRITRKVAELVKINNHLDYAPHESCGQNRESFVGVMVDQVKHPVTWMEPLANLILHRKQTNELRPDEIQKETDTTVAIIEHVWKMLWRDVQFNSSWSVKEGSRADLHPDGASGNATSCR